MVKDMNLPRLAWIGLFIAVIGWGFLFVSPSISPDIAEPAEAASARDRAAFLALIGQNAIVTGLAITLLGGMEKALRLLGRLAAAVPPPRAQGRTAMALAQLPQRPVQTPPLEPAPAAAPPRTTAEVVTRGMLNGRDYVLFRDGSVLVETLLGPRRFPSITDAQTFIGINAAEDDGASLDG
jgi:hypothetical protein